MEERGRHKDAGEVKEDRGRRKRANARRPGVERGEIERELESNRKKDRIKAQ